MSCYSSKEMEPCFNYWEVYLATVTRKWPSLNFTSSGSTLLPSLTYCPLTTKLVDLSNFGVCVNQLKLVVHFSFKILQKIVESWSLLHCNGSIRLIGIICVIFIYSWSLYEIFPSLECVTMLSTSTKTFHSWYGKILGHVNSFVTWHFHGAFDVYFTRKASWMVDHNRNVNYVYTRIWD